MFQPVVGFKAKLKTKLSPDEVILPLSPNDIAQLAQWLDGADRYTRLWIGDGVAHEIVKASVVDGFVVIERRQEGTQSQTFPAGACASFAWTPANLADFIQQGLGGWQPAICSLKAGSDRIAVTQADCEATIDLPACEEATWRSGNQRFTQGAGGCIDVASVDTPLVDGEYVNATLTVRDGHIVAIRSGTNIVYSGGGCCCGGSGT